MRMNLGRTPRTGQGDRDFGRRPELNVDINPTSTSQDGYKRMMGSLSVAEMDARQKGKHSEFEKPYIPGIKYSELQSFHPSNWPSVTFSLPGINPDINMPTGGVGAGVGAEVGVGGCEEVWDKCLQQVCGNPAGCSGSGVVQQMQNCAGDCSKPHKEILSCLHFNSLCFCINCQGISSVVGDNLDCGSPQDQGCQDLICSDDPCPSFGLTGGDAAPTVICPTAEICASSVEGGSPNASKCVDVPNEGCGTKNVCVTDACGNQVCKQVRMSTGAWFVISTQGCPCNPGPTCSQIEGATRTDYAYKYCCGSNSYPGGACAHCNDVECSGCSFQGGSPPCAQPCPPNSFCTDISPGLGMCCSIYRIEISEWRCA